MSEGAQEDGNQHKGLDRDGNVDVHKSSTGLNDRRATYWYEHPVGSNKPIDSSRRIAGMVLTWGDYALLSMSLMYCNRLLFSTPRP